MKALLSRHAAASMLKQLALEDAVGSSKSWHVDLGQGVLWFEDGARHPVQLLGTQSDADGTWLWAWANAESHLPPGVIRASERLRQLGGERSIAELVAPKLTPDQADGDRVSMVACGLLDGAGYYRAPYRGGAAYFLFTDFPPKESVSLHPERLLRAIQTVIAAFELDHRTVIQGLAADLHLRLAETADRLVLTAPNGNELELQLDGAGRIANMSGKLTR